MSRIQQPRRMPRVGALQRGAALMAGLLLLAVSTTAHAGAATIDELIWSFDTPASTLDPMLAGDLASEAAISNSVEALVVYDSAGVIVPYLAESWTQPDAKTYVFQLRDNVTFWDGTPMTMDDVMYWMDRIMRNDRSIFQGYFADVESFEQTGDMELTIKLTLPSPTFIQRAVFLFVGQKAYTEQHEEDLGSPDALGIYTGPYQMTEWVPGEGVILDLYDGYWGTKPAAQRINFRSIPDNETRRLALQAGDIHGAFNVPTSQSDNWASDDVTLIAAPNLQIGYLSFDTKQEPWSDIHVRKAVAYALDKAGIVSAVYRDKAKVATTYPPPEEWAALLSPEEITSLYESIPDYEFDLAKAAEELAQSAFPDGFSAELPIPTGAAELEQIALSLSANLATIGIDLQVKNVSTRGVSRSLVRGEGEHGDPAHPERPQRAGPLGLPGTDAHRPVQRPWWLQHRELHQPGDRGPVGAADRVD